MSVSDDQWIIAGCFGRVHGVKGFITVNSYMHPADNLLTYQPWFQCIDKTMQPLDLTTIEIVNQKILVQVAGYAQREQVRTLTNRPIYIARTQLPSLPKGEYYWFELIGLTVINQQHEELGRVIELMETGSNDVLVVEGEKSHLIPYLPGRFVLSIDLANALIRVDWDKDF